MEAHGLLAQVVGPDHGRVAARVAAPDPALFKNGHATGPLPGQVEGSGEAMAAAPDDYDVVCPFRLRATPCRRPVPMTSEARGGEAKAPNRSCGDPDLATG